MINAIKSNDLSKVKELIDQGAKLLDGGEKAIRLSMKHPDRQILNYLISSDFEEEGVKERFIYAIKMAVEYGDLALLKWLKTKNHELVTDYYYKDDEDNKYSRQYLFYEAIRCGYFDMVKFLINEGADIDDSGPKCPLEYAIRCGQYKIMQLLIESGASVRWWVRKEIKKGLDVKALEVLLVNNSLIQADFYQIAVVHNRVDLLKGILKRIELKENVKDLSHDSHYFLFQSFFLALDKSYSATAIFCLEEGLDLGDKKGETLEIAIKKGMVDLVKCLIERGIEPRSGDLTIAVSKESEDDCPIVDFILQTCDLSVSSYARALSKAMEDGKRQIADKIYQKYKKIT